MKKWFFVVLGCLFVMGCGNPRTSERVSGEKVTKKTVTKDPGDERFIEIHKRVLNLNNAPQKVTQENLPPKGKLTFSRNDNIWISDERGQNAKKVTTAGDCGNIVWSPDGRKIVYEKYTYIGEGEDCYVWLLEINDQNKVVKATQLIKDQASSPTWLPKSSQIGLIIFKPEAIGAGQSSNVFAVISPDGKTKKNIFGNSGNASDLVWSEGNKQIYFSGWFAAAPVINQIKIDTKTEKTLYTHPINDNYKTDTQIRNLQLSGDLLYFIEEPFQKGVNDGYRLKKLDIKTNKVSEIESSKQGFAADFKIVSADENLYWISVGPAYDKPSTLKLKKANQVIISIQNIGEFDFWSAPN